MFRPDKDRKTLDRPPGKPHPIDEEARPTVRRPVYKPNLFSGWGPKL